jgi:hypothetical protein
MFKTIFESIWTKVSPAKLRSRQLYEAEVALVEAEAYAEVANATVAVLKARIERLRGAAR